MSNQDIGTLIAIVLGLLFARAVIRYAVVWASTRLLEVYERHALSMHAQTERTRKRLVTNGASREDAQRQVAHIQKELGLVKFIHAWAERVTRRQTHPLSIRHTRALRMIRARQSV